MSVILAYVRCGDTNVYILGFSFNNPLPEKCEFLKVTNSVEVTKNLKIKTLKNTCSLADTKYYFFNKTVMIWTFYAI